MTEEEEKWLVSSGSLSLHRRFFYS